MPDSNARSSIADTFTKLLRLNLAGGPPLVTREQLMAESESHIARTARKGNSPEQQVATQILANPTDYRSWESEHERLMAAVARPNRTVVQARALLSTAFALVHRRALFEYLRGHAVRGISRRELMQHFHGQKSYSQAIVAEHGNYLRSSASLMCAEHFGTTILAHQAFGGPFRRYEHLYAEYFRSYCDSYLAPPSKTEDVSDSMRALLPHLKRDVLDVRARLLAMPPAPPPGAPGRR
ncbi:MAG: hypothetical protein KGL25_10720 [Gammaproteobacteria bacterium]|nr:hypothetical protein [Gammaproteobacteria bacterium]MDE2251860.1 hypothetical protein [Gammaproteobacteria bacterium]